MSLGERVKKVRKARDLTQQQFAERLGMKRNSIAQVEGGRSTSDQTVFAICREFKVNEHWLRTGEGEMFIKPDAERRNLILPLRKCTSIFLLRFGLICWPT